MIKHSSLKNSFKYALDGMSYAMRYDQNFRVHIIAAIFVVLLGIYLHVERIEMIILLVMIVLVITTEMINTAIENMVDLITDEYREKAKIAKDVSSGMVLVATLGAVIIGAMIFTPYVLRALS